MNEKQNSSCSELGVGGWAAETHSPPGRERESEPRRSSGPRTAPSIRVPGLRALVSLSVVQTHRQRPHQQDSCPFLSLAWCQHQAHTTFTQS